MHKTLVLGIDSSTSSCKAIVWDLHGNLIAKGSANLPLYNPKPLWYEQPATAWWESARDAIRIATDRVDARHLAGLCITAQRETFVPIDEQGRALRNGIVWMDERCQSLLPAIESQFGKENIHQSTGKPLTGNLTLGKLLWLREYENNLINQTWKFVDVASYLNHYLTGKFRAGWGNVDPTGLVDMKRQQWSEPILQWLGINNEQLPEAFPAGNVIGEVTPEAAKECNLPAGLPVFAGLGDGQSACLGTNILDNDHTCLSLGTSVVTGSFSDTYLTDPAFRTMYGALPGTYLLETVLLGGTYTLDWLSKFISGVCGETHSLVELLGKIHDHTVQNTTAGADGLMLVPYWHSAMDPYWDGSASGIIIGWRGNHKPEHLYRAILEGIGYEIRLQISGVEAALDRNINNFVITGGGASNRFWCQIIADITGKTIFHSYTNEAASLGAGILAAYGAGLFRNIHTASEAMVRVQSGRIEPGPDRGQIYNQLYQEVYCHLYMNLRPYLNRLAGLSRNIEAL